VPSGASRTGIGGAGRSGGDASGIGGVGRSGADASGVGGASARGPGAASHTGGAQRAATAGGGGNGAVPVAGVELAPANWNSILAQLDVSGLARQLANNCVLIGRQGNLVRLGLDPRNNMMRVPNAVDKLAQALSKYLGETVRVEFEAPIAGAETPAQAEKRAVAEEFDHARQSLESDPAVRALRETFGATLLPDSVRPLK
jgi:DNA polymerase-3 subunit gamma/tau